MGVLSLSGGVAGPPAFIGLEFAAASVPEFGGLHVTGRYLAGQAGDPLLHRRAEPDRARVTDAKVMDPLPADSELSGCPLVGGALVVQP